MTVAAAAIFAGSFLPRRETVAVPVPPKRVEPTRADEIAAAKKAIATAMAPASLTTQETALIDSAVDAVYAAEYAGDLGFHEQRLSIRGADLQLTMDVREDLVLITFGRWGHTPYVGFFVDGDAIPAAGTFSDAADLA